MSIYKPGRVASENVLLVVIATFAVVLVAQPIAGFDPGLLLFGIPGSVGIALLLKSLMDRFWMNALQQRTLLRYLPAGLVILGTIVIVLVAAKMTASQQITPGTCYPVAGDSQTQVCP